MIVNRSLVGAPLLALVTAGVWWAWLGWDNGYQVDPVTGEMTGPYVPWQVVGCVISLAVVAAAAGWVLSPWLVVPVMTATFTIAWSQNAAATDDSGLWGVGAVLVFVGMASGATLISSGSQLLRGRRHAGGVPVGV
ncbi:hypothetical protein ABT336_17430 [Micromonospora sp. NPDC000207]|uniref:hypothetical protein n=1 Tax=Micromonospora sp. NPDC000207 TaxID=3154246 RepID=UPI0033188230